MPAFPGRFARQLVRTVDRPRHTLLSAAIGLLLLFIPRAPAAAQTVIVHYEPGAEKAFDAATRALVDSIARRSLTEITAVLPETPDTVRLTVATGVQVIDVTGEVGSTPAAGEVRWMVNASDPRGVPGIVRASLRHTLFHEVHHLARGWTFRGGTPPRNVLDAAIAEGMASVFARDFGGDTALWAQPPADVEQWYAELRALPPAEMMRYAQWMFQHPDGRRWIGYRTGAWIVDRAIAKSGATSVSLVRTPPDDVLRLAGLEPAKP